MVSGQMNQPSGRKSNSDGLTGAAIDNFSIEYTEGVRYMAVLEHNLEQNLEITLTGQQDDT